MDQYFDVIKGELFEEAEEKEEKDEKPGKEVNGINDD
jgi:hypothetical protein